MGGVPTKHHSKSKVGRRRSHLALTKQTLHVCAQCKHPTLPHRACAFCGAYPKKKKQAETTAPQKSS